MDLIDTIQLDGVRRTGDGYLVADARVARSGIQLYAGYQVDPDGSLGLRDKATVRVFRPEDQVFSSDSLRSYAYRPITLDHPDEPVNSKNWKNLAIGQTGGEVVRDGDFVRVPLVLMDDAAIRAVEGGKRELSMGYSVTVRAQDGVTPTGEHYDAIQSGLRMNHLAVVSAARGGPQLKIGDKGERSMTTRTIIVDGLSVEVADRDAQIIQRALDAAAAKIADVEKALADATDAHAKAVAAKDAEIAHKDAELEAIKAKVLDDAAIDARVAARADLVAKARQIVADVKTDGVADADIRKAVVAAKLGDEAVKDKAQAYIDARFDILAEDHKSADDVRSAISHARPAVSDAKGASDALAKANDDLNAWRKGK